MLHDETLDLQMDCDLKPVMDLVKPICRCCLSIDRKVKNVTAFRSEILELAGLDVSESDGLPHWLCYECCALLRKAVRFKRKVLRAHNLLYEYLTRCAPFPIDAQDPELSKYRSPELTATAVLTLAAPARARAGFHAVLQHEKQIQKSELESIELPAPAPADGEVKSEHGFSDFEDNIALNEFRSPVNQITDEDIKSFFRDTAAPADRKEDAPVKKKKLKKVKARKKTSEVKSEEEEPPAKSSIRKTVEVDPDKIRVVTLNPEEQVKQREEESKAGLKFPFQCRLCHKGFNFSAKLDNHMAKHSPSRGPFECKLCHMFLPTAYSFSVHSLIHTRRFECLQCGRRMIDRTSILDHYKSQHEGQLTLYTCNLCGKVSNNSKTHRGHMRNHHSGDRPKCDRCGKTFVNKDSLAEHQQIHDGIKNYECSVCGKRFRTRTQIKHHQLKHSDAKDYYCVECDVRFKSAHNLRQHLQKSMKHKDKQTLKFECPRCDKRFDTEPALTHHSLVQHDGVRPHRCAICPAALATRSSLAKHTLAVHAGRRPPPRHVCDTCGKAFRGKSVLTNHVRTHTGEKPFACAHCGRSFTQRTAMRTHVNLVHLKLPRHHKVKEVPAEAREPKMDMFVKEDQPLVFESWSRPQMPCDVYFTVTAGP